MNLLDSLIESYEYTVAIFRRIRELLILFVISIIPIVDFMILGYYARVIRDDPSSETPPKLENYMNTFMEGLKITAVMIIWAILIGIISVIIAIPFMAISIPVINWADPLYWTTPGAYLPPAPFIVVLAVVAFPLGFIAFMGIVHMVKRNSFTKAFALGEIFSIIGKIGWLRYLAYFAISFVILTISGAIAATLWIISAIIAVLVGIFLARTIGLLYDQATKPSTQPMTQPPPPTPPEVNRFCSKCGEELPFDAKYCSRCGRGVT
jgi:hypothetical protein